MHTHPTSTYPCPVCASGRTEQVLLCTDYTVSKEQFAIWHCAQCTHRFTAPVPGARAIGRYYSSEAYVSHSDTRKGLINRLYHQVRRRTLRQKLGWAQQYSGLSQGRLLDVGAGTGAFAHTAAQAGWQVTALEPDASAVEKASQLYGIPLKPLTTMPTLAAGHYDVITLWHVLEHVHDLHGYMQQFYRLLAPGGQLLVAVPNYTSADAAHYGAYWAAYDVPRHLYHFSPASMQALAAQHGLVVHAKEGMWYDAYYVSMLSEQCRHGRPRYLPALYMGYRSNAAARKNLDRCSSLVYVMKKEVESLSEKIL